MERSDQGFSVEDWLRIEAERKAHLNALHIPEGYRLDLNDVVPPPGSPPPPVWGGWGQPRPRLKLPPSLLQLGFPFVPPDPPPPTDEEKEAVEFRKMVAGIVPNGAFPEDSSTLPPLSGG